MKGAQNGGGVSRCIATSMFWRKNAVARESPVLLESRAPISDDKDQALAPQAHKVSTRKGICGFV